MFEPSFDQFVMELAHVSYDRVEHWQSANYSNRRIRGKHSEELRVYSKGTSMIGQPEAFIKLPTEGEVRAASGGHVHPYETYLGGVVARMARLLMAHPLIGPAFRQLFRTVMFEPGTLSRVEREMVASVATAAQRCVY